MTPLSAGHRFAHQAMRTGIELLVADPDRDQASARAIAQEVFAEIDAVESLLSAFRPASDLHRINAAAGRGPIKVDARVVDFLMRARDLVTATAGAFDPTVGTIMNLLRGSGPPTVDELRAAQAQVGFALQVAIDETRCTVALRDAGARLDPGALGKGYALDRAAAILIDLGVGAALLHAGTSSALAFGRDGFRVAIADPGGDGGAHANLATCNLHHQSLSVSAVSGRRLAWPDGRTGHVVDPRTGAPAAAARLAAVIAGNGVTAEGWSTALLVLGRDGVQEFARAVPGGSAFIAGADPAGGDLAVHGPAFTVC